MIMPVEALVNILAPSWCINCGRPVSFRNAHLCDSCHERIVYTGESCPVCSGFIAGGECVMCRDRAVFFRKNTAVMEYDGVAKEMLHHFKFNGKKRLFRPIGQLALEAWKADGQRVDLVTPVPMSPAKEWRRGYNQSALVARYVARSCSVPYRKILMERKDAKTQREQGYYNRFLNVLGRYELRKRVNIEGMNILLVDDVFTTGATLNECARIMLEAGAGGVFCLTLARAGIKRLEK